MSVAPMVACQFDGFSIERRSRARFPLNLAVE
jgi:hypothetical protein